MGMRWTRIQSNAAWTARYQAGAVVYDGKLWIMGGIVSGGSLSNDVWSSVDGITWIQATAAAGWSPRRQFGCCVFDNQIWVAGGEAVSPTQFRDVWSSSDGISWTLRATAANWERRHSFRMLSHAGRLWVIGGASSWIFDNGQVWSSADGALWVYHGLLPTGFRSQYGACVFNGEMFVCFGVGQNSVLSSADGNTWTTRRVQGAAGNPAGSPAGTETVPYASQLWSLGGSAAGDGALYSNDSGATWTRDATGTWSNRRNHCSLVMGGYVYMFGGESPSGSGTVVNDVWRGTAFPEGAMILPDATAKISHARILRAHRSPAQAQAFHQAMQGAL